MKKIFLIGLAATAMLASCSNDETVEMAQNTKAIGFSSLLTRAPVLQTLTSLILQPLKCTVGEVMLQFSTNKR